MGLIKAITAAAGSVLADQWKEYFYCDSLTENVLVRKGKKRVSSRSSNTKGSDNIISSGSVIAVADGQCMIIVDQGKIVEICAEPGEFTYDSSAEPSIFAGSLGDSVQKSFVAMGRRFTFGGDAARDQRVYYFNTKELTGNKYGTPSPVPFKVVDMDIGYKTNVNIRCFGEYSYHICDPILFYRNVCGNITGDFTRDRLDGQLKTELLTALQPALGRISDMRIDYTSLPAHTMEIANALNEVLSDTWRNKRGLEIVSFGVSSVKASEEDEARLQEMQRSAFLGSSASVMAGHMAGATAAAMQAAASNQATGPMMAFAGMNMAGAAGGMNLSDLMQMGQQQKQAEAARQAEPARQAAPAGWKCPGCGATATGKFCPECGTKKPEATGWKCACGSVNKGKFCPECGAKKPASEPLYRCDKCGWEPEDPKHPPKFCPECGDIFDDRDIR